MLLIRVCAWCNPPRIIGCKDSNTNQDCITCPYPCFLQFEEESRADAYKTTHGICNYHEFERKAQNN